MSPNIQYNSITVSVDSFRNKVLCGKLFTTGEEAMGFESLIELFIKTEEILERSEMAASQDLSAGYDSGAWIRSGLDTTLQYMETGKLATFVIDIMFRQNKSWQGSVVWLEGKKKLAFRSALELTFLINGALEDTEA